mmetsp:Transcript_76656/g.201115  ORF Transcript_76656/g.201115 Transcript_76656/m.201115 type:complete len:308 (-) Transcript_76656:233-1156(-)
MPGARRARGLPAVPHLARQDAHAHGLRRQGRPSRASRRAHSSQGRGHPRVGRGGASPQAGDLRRLDLVSGDRGGGRGPPRRRRRRQRRGALHQDLPRDLRRRHHRGAGRGSPREHGGRGRPGGRRLPDEDRPLLGRTAERARGSPSRRLGGRRAGAQAAAEEARPGVCGGGQPGGVGRTGCGAPDRVRRARRLRPWLLGGRLPPRQRPAAASQGEGGGWLGHGLRVVPRGPRLGLPRRGGGGGGRGPGGLAPEEPAPASGPEGLRQLLRQEGPGRPRLRPQRLRRPRRLRGLPGRDPQGVVRPRRRR